MVRTGRTAVESVDVAYQVLTRMMPEIINDLGTSTTEADTRLRVIDRVLIEILGWPRADIKTEEKTDTGFADYVCKWTFAHFVTLV